MKKLLLFSQKNEYENSGDDKRDNCKAVPEGGLYRRVVAECSVEVKFVDINIIESIVKMKSAIR